MNKKLTREFYLHDANAVARDLLGKALVHRTDEGTASGIIVETEAYPGGPDAASHAYLNRKTRRTAVQFGPGGFAYVFLIYGMHCCFNVVTANADEPQVVLIRALEPFEGIELMKKRRNTDDVARLCSGPGKLCAALGIAMAHYGEDLTGGNGCLSKTSADPAGSRRQSASTSTMRGKPHNICGGMLRAAIPLFQNADDVSSKR